MNEFRDAMSDAIANALDFDCERPLRTADKAAVAVLDMPEMHALRTYLAMEFRPHNPRHTPDRYRSRMIDEGIPANVADWVLS